MYSVYDVIANSEKTKFCSIKMDCVFFVCLLSFSAILIHSSSLICNYDIPFSNSMCLATFSLKKIS